MQPGNFCADPMHDERGSVMEEGGLPSVGVSASPARPLFGPWVATSPIRQLRHARVPANPRKGVESKPDSQVRAHLPLIRTHLLPVNRHLACLRTPTGGNSLRSFLAADHR